ncbi:hypothetical protein ACROYT_G038332 [Oculina patagonica]
MKPFLTITGSRTEEGFVKIPLQVELHFGKGYHSIIDGQESVVYGESTGVLKAFMSLKETLVNLKTSFLRTYDDCDPKEFYHNLRPYLAGWDGNPVLPVGLIYEGVSKKPLKVSACFYCRHTVMIRFSARTLIANETAEPRGEAVEAAES